MTNKKVTTKEAQTTVKNALVYNPADFKTKSEAIRFYAAQGHTRSEIAKSMGILYQHVRNVLTQPAKKAK